MSSIMSYNSLVEDIQNYWREHDIFNKSIVNRSGQPSFVFYEGPPSANGQPGIHHVISRTLKDLVCRMYTYILYLLQIFLICRLKQN